MVSDYGFYHGTVKHNVPFFHIFSKDNGELNKWMLNLFLTKNRLKEFNDDTFTVSLTEKDLKRLEIDYYRSCYAFHHKMKGIYYKKVVTLANPSIEVEINHNYEHEYPIGEIEFDLSTIDLKWFFSDAKHYLSLKEKVFYKDSTKQ